MRTSPNGAKLRLSFDCEKHMFGIILVLKARCEKINAKTNLVNFWISDYIFQFIQPIITV